MQTNKHQRKEPETSAKEIIFTGTPEEISKQWHAQRDKGIGGSDVGVIMGFNHWKTISQLWKEKTGRTKPEDITHKPCVILGNALEPALRDEYAYRHPDVKVEEPLYMLQDEAKPWRQASLDGIITCPDGMREVLEIKTVGMSSAKYWEPDTVPISYACQVLHYMAVSGYRRAQLIAMIGNSRIVERSVDRDELLIEIIEEAVDEFWDHVQADKPPVRHNPTMEFKERFNSICYDPTNIPLF